MILKIYMRRSNERCRKGCIEFIYQPIIAKDFRLVRFKNLFAFFCHSMTCVSYALIVVKMLLEFRKKRIVPSPLVQFETSNRKAV